ncbi:hypothetical protein GH714_019625 [Hevea brasiliensis]|uniref:BTB domain-containing protein n=1 Tax=Hevea brasiliensis TaxID=3981 RepID=A0A6A6K7J1_HEVBR|nr:hypothetical protein GH714_019625 [Hevea brasiliensis]
MCVLYLMEPQSSQDRVSREEGHKRKLEEEIEEERREISTAVPFGDARQALCTSGCAVPALVKHLQAPQSSEADRPKPFEHEVEKGSAFALGLLAVKPEHQQLIVDTGALSLLVDLLKRHKDGSSCRAVSIVMEGGIPPLVELLEFVDTKVQRAAAGALRTLAFKNDENKTQIVECNALPTLILMLRSEDAAIHYEAVGVIGNLVHSSPNIKKEVLAAGALQPVIGLLSSCCSESQREAALLLGQFAATDSDCKVHIVQRGAVQPLIEMLHSPDLQLREMSAFALGRLAQDSHNQAGIAYNGGLVPLLKLLDSKNGSLQHNAAFALYGLADNEGGRCPEAARWGIFVQVYLGEQYVNNSTLSDVTFLVEGRRFCAHRICLLASSDAFRAMFDGGYLEKDARDIEIPNIRWEVFELMMRFIYTGSIDISLDIAQDLLRAADQYLLEGLKRLCEYTIAQKIVDLLIHVEPFEGSKSNRLVIWHIIFPDTRMLFHVYALNIVSIFLDVDGEVEVEIAPFVRIYKDGSVERLMGAPIVPPSSQDPETGVSSKDITISQNPPISARLYLPKLTEPTQQLDFSSQSRCYLSRVQVSPEHLLPIAYEDCWAALQWVASHSIEKGINNKDPWISNYGDLGRLYIGGDSAGANIAHNILMRASTEALPGDVKIFGAYLTHPFFWGAEPVGSEYRVEREKQITYTLWAMVYPSAPGGIDNPMMNPVASGAPNLGGLGCSQLLVSVAEKDLLRDRGILYHKAVKESGWKGEVELIDVEGEGHAFHILNCETESAKNLIKRLASFLLK